MKKSGVNKVYKERAIIIDIDGTLANCDHRRHFVDGTHDKKDWRSFYEAMEHDTLNRWCHELIYNFTQNEGERYDCIFVSGRPEEYREITLKWFLRNNVDWGALFMRKTGDYRDDTIIKEEIYREHIEPDYNIFFVIDDRAKVVKMWRRLGLVALHCADGDF
jgi:hypothetical protein